MKVPVETEVIPIWFIEKWKRDNDVIKGSPLDFYLSQLLKDWKSEELRKN